jgi:hypothetical protein
MIHIFSIGRTSVSHEHVRREYIYTPLRNERHRFRPTVVPFSYTQQIDKAASYYTALNATLPGGFNQSVAVMGEGSYVSLFLDDTSIYKIDASNLYLPDILPAQSIQW